MKKLLLPILIGAILLGCSKKKTEISKVQEPVAKECNPRTSTTANSAEAQKRLTGTWKLTVYNSGWVIYSGKDAPDQQLTFKGDGTCIVTRKDTTYAVKYVLQSPPGQDKNYYQVPLIVTSDTVRYDLLQRPIGTSSLFICDGEMILDYGLGRYADAPVVTYRREIK